MPNLAGFYQSEYIFFTPQLFCQKIQTMSKIKFWKYQANGNDFVIVDNREDELQISSEQIRRMCDRHFGIGADGFMFVNVSEDANFEMLYYNSDGQISSMCGNGGRCIAMFAYLNEIAGERMEFKAFDGIHIAIIEDRMSHNLCDVSLSMTNVEEVQKNDQFYFLNTGSPHYIEFVKKVAELDVFTEGRKTRQSERFMPDGTNVNFVELRDERLFVRTYERGVEDETLSCGTGVTASAIAAYFITGKNSQIVHTTGGEFVVDFIHQQGDRFTDIWLRGPAELVFEGEILL